MTPPNRVGGGIGLPPPTPPSKRVTNYDAVVTVVNPTKAGNHFARLRGGTFFFGRVPKLDGTPNQGQPSGSDTRSLTPELAPQTPGVSASFLRFIDTGPPSFFSGQATIEAGTNWSLFGRPSSSVGPTNITVTNATGVFNITTTNAVYHGGPAAEFQYTNSSQHMAWVTVQSIEYAAGGVWHPAPLPTEAWVSYEISPNSSQTQEIPVSATNVVLRITALVERAEEPGKHALAGQKAEHFSGRNYLIKAASPAIK